MMCQHLLRPQAMLLVWVVLLAISRIAIISAFGVNFPMCVPPRSYFRRATSLWAKTEERSSADLSRRDSLIKEFGITPDRHDLFWLDRYIDLENYKRIHGDCLVPQKYPENQQLGTWVNNQRRNYRYLVQTDNPHREKTKQESSLNGRKWRLDLLERIGFAFREDNWEDVWEQSFEKLVEYKDEHGNCNVPQDYKKNPKLAKWVTRQRTEYRLKQEGKESDITDARIKKLEMVGFQWYINGPLVPWEDRFKQLKEFKNRFNHCNIPRGWQENRELSYWVNTQRMEYRLLQDGKKSFLTEERIELLDSIGFKWTVQVPWEERFEELNEFKQRLKHCNVPQGWEENRELGVWVREQRQQYRLLQEGKASSMTEERIELLESIGFKWYVNGPNVPWEKRFEELEAFKKRFKHCNVPFRWEENRELGIWVRNQRAQYRLMQEGKPSNINDERIKLLESIGFQWSLQKRR